MKKKCRAREQDQYKEIAGWFHQLISKQAFISSGYFSVYMECNDG